MITALFVMCCVAMVMAVIFFGVEMTYFIWNLKDRMKENEEILHDKIRKGIK